MERYFKTYLDQDIQLKAVIFYGAGRSGTTVASDKKIKSIYQQIYEYDRANFLAKPKYQQCQWQNTKQFLPIM